MPTRTRARRAKHRPGCRHCYRVGLLGLAFRDWRESWEAGLEDEAMGYKTESMEYHLTNPSPTFKKYLIQMTGAGWPMSGQAPRRRFIS